VEYEGEKLMFMYLWDEEDFKPDLEALLVRHVNLF
jgi:hypothetical protein